MKKVLIAGATGYLGRYIVEEFKKQGFWIRALTRNTGALNDLKPIIDEVSVAEVTDADTLTNICKDIDVVFSAVGITKQKDGLTYMDVDYQGNMNLLHEAQKRNVKQFIYVSALNGPNLRDLKMIDAKERFVDGLKKSGIDYVVIRPNGFFSDIAEFLHMAKKGKGYVFGSGNWRMNPIHGKDLAEVCVQAVSSQEKEIDVGGPDILTHNQILETAFSIYKKPVKISKIPIWVRNGLLSLMRFLTPVKVYGPVEFFMTVLASDMVAPQYGRIHLKEFFEEEAGSENNQKLMKK